MSLLALLVLAVGLAMDAMAVSAARGLATQRVLARHIFLVSAFFGGFQALMPLLGWVLGNTIGPIVRAWQHWVAFVLLSGIGAKMLWEARGSAEEDHEDRNDEDLFGLKTMFLLALATSIDAFAAGVTLPMMKAPLALSLATIGLTTAALSALGLVLGRRFGSLFGKRLDVAGGLVLIGLGVKMLVDHFRA